VHEKDAGLCINFESWVEARQWSSQQAKELGSSKEKLLMFLTGNVRVRTDSEQRDIKLNINRGWNRANY